MFPYLLMIGLPATLAIATVRRAGFLLLAVAILYWLMVGFRYHVGMDWNNYLSIYLGSTTRSFTDLLFSTEPAYQLLMWSAANLGGGLILINAVSALVFCWGFFAVAKRCREPFLAIVIATPLLVIAFAMSGVRQAMAMGIIYYLYATWENRGAIGRMMLVVVASVFHFSAIFVLIFVALSSKASQLTRIAAAIASGLLLLLFLYLAPEATEGYHQRYVAGPRTLEAPGALAQVGVLAVAALVYFTIRKIWIEVNGRNPLYESLAVAALIAVPATYYSSVGAYRFALYLWPMAMYIFSGLPALTASVQLRALYRVIVVTASVVLLVGWLSLSNSGSAWLPYKNWLLQEEGARLRR